MSAPKPLEVKLLEPVDHLLTMLAKQTNSSLFESRLQILEATASQLGSFSLSNYYETFSISLANDEKWLQESGKKIVEALSHIPIHPSLALSSLAREPLEKAAQRSSGAFHTDFRLAKYIAKLGNINLTEKTLVLDPACGAGILLVATSITACSNGSIKIDNWLSNNIFAADVSNLALRGARLALASLTDKVSTIKCMWDHWLCGDSLMIAKKKWNEIAPDGFDLIIGNPPWEKVKLTRHEYLQAQGVKRHYGSDCINLDAKEYLIEKNKVAKYADALTNKYTLLGSGEPDLYMAFLELFTQLIKQGGRIAILLPAGLIRSYGTKTLRRFLFNYGKELSFTVMDNRAKFFSIDTRFKFLAMSFIWSNQSIESNVDPVYLFHTSNTEKEVTQTKPTLIQRQELIKIRPDFSIPEVRNNKEWNIFLSMTQCGVDWSNKESKWHPEIVREVDMTRHRTNFSKNQHVSRTPVIEGRMVQTHRFGAKTYEFGSGRKAIWSPLPLGYSQITPQFWIDTDNLNTKTLERYQSDRVGFCDIAGQTNERSMTAALIPPGVVCGNKVPTIIFPNDSSVNRLYLWSAIANSIPFDWMLRRVLTTTVNYFLLLSLPLPNLELDSLAGHRLINISKKLSALGTAEKKFDIWSWAKLRAEADLLVLIAYKLDYKDLKVILDDFPLLDRGQPSVYDEQRSTITRDYLLLIAAKHFKQPVKHLQERVDMAKKNGALPYIPSELVVTPFNKKECMGVK